MKKDKYTTEDYETLFNLITTMRENNINIENFPQGFEQMIQERHELQKYIKKVKFVI